jgi:hypothetical protein
MVILSKLDVFTCAIIEGKDWDSPKMARDTRNHVGIVLIIKEFQEVVKSLAEKRF